MKGPYGEEGRTTALGPQDAAAARAWEAAALGELYDRFASLVHGLAHRVLGDERAADRITRDVFAHVWEHPDAYDPRQGRCARGSPR